MHTLGTVSQNGDTRSFDRADRHMDRWVISSIDNLRVVAEAKGKGWRSGDVAPPLPGVDWACWKDDGNVGEEWWATALAQRQPLVMRTSEQFYGALERCVVGQSQFFLERNVSS